MSEYTGMATRGPSAAFFDLDRTLISGSSAFVVALAARRAGYLALASSHATPCRR